MKPPIIIKIITILMAYIISTLEMSIFGSKVSIKLACKSRRSRLSLMDVPISKVPFRWLFFSTLWITLKVKFVYHYEKDEQK